MESKHPSKHTQKVFSRLGLPEMSFSCKASLAAYGPIISREALLCYKSYILR